MLFIEHYDTTFDNCHFESLTPQLTGWTFVDARTRELTMRNSHVNSTVANSTRFNFASPNLRLEMNHFLGRGVLEFAQGPGTHLLRRADIVSNTFEGNFTAVFGDVTHGVLQMRNNIGMQYRTAHGSAVQCDAGTEGGIAASTGVAAGCDLRSECRDLSEGGVNCTCEPPLTFKAGIVPDGSECDLQGQLLHIFQDGHSPQTC